MRSHYKKLGPYIRQVDVRNVEDKKDNLLGVSTQKIFIESIANTVGTDFTKYKVVKKNQFTYVPDTSRRGNKIGLAMLEHLDEGLVSSAYTVFEIIDPSELLPEYLMMWFRRPEFDRYARYHSHGSVREIFGWEEMCDVELPIPSPEKQREIVDEYNTIINRIKLNEQLCQKLEETAQALYKHWFVDFEFPIPEDYAQSIGKPQLAGHPYKSNGGEMEFNKTLEKAIPVSWGVKPLVDLCKIKGGKRLPAGKSLVSIVTPHPYIKVADLGTCKFTVLNNKFEYLMPDIQKSISRYIVNSQDLVISIVGTIGIVRIIDESLAGANLTENCVKINNFSRIDNNYLYHFLQSWEGKNQLEMKTVGGVQGKLPIYNIESFKILCPEASVMKHFRESIERLNSFVKVKLREICALYALKDILLAKSSVEEKLFVQVH